MSRQVVDVGLGFDRGEVKAAGVTRLSVNPVGDSPLAVIEQIDTPSLLPWRRGSGAALGYGPF